MLRLNNIVKIFDHKKVIDGISLTVQPGEIAVLLGGSGVGKSTLLRILNNLETLDGGTIILDDKPLNLAYANKHHIVGMVFQNFNLFDHLTAEQNVMLPLQKVIHKTPEEARTIAHKLLEHYHLLDKKNDYPSNLSGGQKQRLAIARSLTLKPTIMCFDEPTSALDPLLTSHVAQNIQELAQQGYIILVASHDTELIKKISCTLYLMHAGKIIEKATSEQFQKNSHDFPRLSNFIAGRLEQE